MTEIPVRSDGPTGPSSNQLYRSRSNRVIGGVCGGIGLHFNVDPTIIRVVFVLLSFGYLSGLLIYIILMLIIPEEPDGFSHQ